MLRLRGAELTGAREHVRADRLDVVPVEERLERGHALAAKRAAENDVREGVVPLRRQVPEIRNDPAADCPDPVAPPAELVKEVVAAKDPLIGGR